LGGKVRPAYAKRLLDGFRKLNFVPLINPDMIFETGNNLKGLAETQPRSQAGQRTVHLVYEKRQIKLSGERLNPLRTLSSRAVRISDNSGSEKES
jgi:hypothetical protein